MKKLILTVVVVGVLGGGYYYVRTHARVSLDILEGKTVKSHRGDLVRPITASGKIEPASVIKIKGEASGEVIKTPFSEGAMAKKGDLIIQLDPSDEQRNVDQAEADSQRARIATSQAELGKERAENQGITLAMSHLLQAEARRIQVQVQYDHKFPLTQPSGDTPPAVSREEWEQTRSAKLEADAAKMAAEAELGQARLAVRQAALELETTEENLKTAGKRLEDAKERRKETSVYSPIDGMILSRQVQIGEIVLSGKTSLTGGTVLMEIADVSDIYAVVNVDEADIGEVREVAPASAVPGPLATRPATLPAHVLDKGQEVEVTVESFVQEKFYGLIERIAPQSQFVQAIATFKVWIRITSANRDRLVGLLNTQAEARFTVKSVVNAVLVSYDAIHKDPHGEGHGVYVRVTNPKTGLVEHKFRSCKFGIDNGIDVEVVEGLQVGEEVYTNLPQLTRKEQEAADAKGQTD